MRGFGTIIGLALVGLAIAGGSKKKTANGGEAPGPKDLETLRAQVQGEFRVTREGGECTHIELLWPGTATADLKIDHVGAWMWGELEEDWPRYLLQMLALWAPVDPDETAIADRTMQDLFPGCTPQAGNYDLIRDTIATALKYDWEWFG